MGKTQCRLEALLDINNASQGFEKLLKCACGKHNRISAPANVFSNLQKPPSLVFFEIKKKDLAIDLNFLGRKRVVATAMCIRIHHILPSLRGSSIPAVFESSIPPLCERGTAIT
jgi:hypothetical protein